MLAAIRNQRWSDEQFFKVRNEEELPQWETGKALQNLDECIDAPENIEKVLTFVERLEDTEDVLSLIPLLLKNAETRN